MFTNGEWLFGYIFISTYLKLCCKRHEEIRIKGFVANAASIHITVLVVSWVYQSSAYEPHHKLNDMLLTAEYLWQLEQPNPYL